MERSSRIELAPEENKNTNFLLIQKHTVLFVDYRADDLNYKINLCWLNIFLCFNLKN